MEERKLEVSDFIIQTLENIYESIVYNLKFSLITLDQDKQKQAL